MTLYYNFDNDINSFEFEVADITDDIDDFLYEMSGEDRADFLDFYHWQDIDDIEQDVMEHDDDFIDYMTDKYFDKAQDYYEDTQDTSVEDEDNRERAYSMSHKW